MLFDLRNVLDEGGTDVFLCILTVSGWLMLLSSRRTITVPAILLLVIVAFSSAQLFGRWAPKVEQYFDAHPHMQSNSLHASFEVNTDGKVRNANDKSHFDTDATVIDSSVLDGLRQLFLGPYAEKEL